MHKNGHNSLSQFAYGQVQAYSEAIRIIEAAAAVFPVEFPCARHSFCLNPAKMRTPDGRYYCHVHAPSDTDLTISEHDDQRDRA